MDVQTRKCPTFKTPRTIGSTLCLAPVHWIQSDWRQPEANDWELIYFPLVDVRVRLIPFSQLELIPRFFGGVKLSS